MVNLLNLVNGVQKTIIINYDNNKVDIDNKVFQVLLLDMVKRSGIDIDDLDVEVVVFRN